MTEGPRVSEKVVSNLRAHLNEKDVPRLISDDAYQTSSRFAALLQEPEHRKYISDNPANRKFLIRTLQLRTLAEKTFDEIVPGRRLREADAESPGSTFSQIMAVTPSLKFLPPDVTTKLVGNALDKGKDIRVRAESIFAFSISDGNLHKNAIGTLLNEAGRIMSRPENSKAARATAKMAMDNFGDKNSLELAHLEAKQTFFRNAGEALIREVNPVISDIFEVKISEAIKRPIRQELQRNDNLGLDAHISKLYERFGQKKESDYEKEGANDPLEERTGDLAELNAAIRETYSEARSLRDQPGADIDLAKVRERGQRQYDERPRSGHSR